MALASLLLSAAAVLFAGLGVLLVPIPMLGAVFAFGAPLAALVGVVIGGRALSEQRRAGRPADLARTAVILNAVALVPALLTALTCGVCNALCAGGPLEVRRDVRFRVGSGAPLHGQGALDAAVPPGLVPPPLPDGTAVAPPRDGGTAAPPPVFPPPPLGR